MGQLLGAAGQALGECPDHELGLVGGHLETGVDEVVETGDLAACAALGGCAVDKVACDAEGGEVNLEEGRDAVCLGVIDVPEEDVLWEVVGVVFDAGGTREE